jgi:hypothetical protein
MKIQQTVGEKFGKKFQKVAEAIAALDNQIITLGDTTQSENVAKDFDKEYKLFVKLTAKLAALVGA